MVSAQVMNFRKTLAIDDLVRENTNQVTDFLYNLSQTRKNFSLEESIYDDCQTNIEESLRYSTQATFNNEFWRALPPQIQNKIVASVLSSQTNMLSYFFNDIIGGIKAPQGFVTKVMVGLESTLYDVGDTIINAGDSVDDLVFIVSGSCDLHGTHTVPAFNAAKFERLRPGFYEKPNRQEREIEEEMEEFKIKVVTLRPGAWFGDYQIMVNVKSSWELKASKASKQG